MYVKSFWALYFPSALVHSLSSESDGVLAHRVSSMALPMKYCRLFTFYQLQQQCRWKDSFWRLPSTIKWRHNRRLELLFIHKKVEQTQAGIPSNLQGELWSVWDEMRTVIFGEKSFLCSVAMSSLQNYHHYARTVDLKTQFCMSTCDHTKSRWAYRAGAPLPTGKTRLL